MAIGAIFLWLIVATSRSSNPASISDRVPYIALFIMPLAAALSAVPYPALLGDALAAARGGGPLVIAAPAVFHFVWPQRACFLGWMCPIRRTPRLRQSQYLCPKAAGNSSPIRSVCGTRLSTAAGLRLRLHRGHHTKAYRMCHRCWWP